jgi:hypothetical protein
MVKRTLSLLAAALTVGALAAGPAFGSSHREAPLISGDPEADLTDLYAFVDRASPGKVNLITAAVPLEEPGDAPNYYRFGDNVAYDINIDNNGDARPDVTYRFRFRTHVRNGDIFLYNTGPVTSLNDADLNVRQTYDVWRISWTASGSMRKSTRIGNDLPVVPNNIGPRSTPNFHGLVTQGVRSVGSGSRSWAGQSDDPFFMGLSQIGDLVNVQPKGTATDTLGGFNVQAIALQVPKTAIVRPGHPIVGIWSDTERQTNVNVLTGKGSGALTQIERLGMPLTNEVLIGLDDKDRWAQRGPRGDAVFDHYLLNPVLATVLGAPDHNRTDILAAFHTGIKGLNQTGGPHADLLRLNTGIPAAGTEKHLGVLDGDLAGFPNGRRLADDVVDIELQVVAGELIGSPNDVSDNVQRNDRPFMAAFPYLALAHQGFEHTHHLPASASRIVM